MNRNRQAKLIEMETTVQRFMPHRQTYVTISLLLVVLALALTGCGNSDNIAVGVQLMKDQPRFDPYEASIAFADGGSARTLVDGTVARGQLRLDEHMYTGRVDGDFATTFPMPVTAELVARGQERFNIYCAPCHGPAADGQGVMAEFMKQPPSFHDQRLIDAPPGYFFNAITNGFGLMLSYSARVAPADRWAIIAYVKAMQQNPDVDVATISADALKNIEGK